MLGKTNATVSSGGSGGGDGATVTAVNKIGAAITSGDKVWLNPYALTAEQICSTSYSNVQTYLMADNPNKVYSMWNSGGLYVATINEDNTLSSFTLAFSVYTPYIWRIDENNDGIMDNIYGAYYNFSNDTGKIYQPRSDSQYYRINRYFVLYNNVHEIIKLDDEQNVVMTYTTASGSSVVTNNPIIAIDETTLIGSSGTYLQIVKLNNTDSTYTATKTMFQSTSIVGYFPQANMILASTANDIDNFGLLKCYRWTGETLEEISPDELPSGLASCYTVSSKVFCNAYTNIITAFQQDEKKLIAYQYINGQWVDISPVIPDLPDYGTTQATQAIFSISADNTRAVYNGKAPSTNRLHIYNLTSVNQYAAVPYLSTNSDSVTGYAAEDAAIDASFTANVAGKTS